MKSINLPFRVFQIAGYRAGLKSIIIDATRFHHWNCMNRKQSPPGKEKLPRTIRHWLKEHRIEEIEAVVPDMTGVARGKILPAKKYREETGLRLPEGIFLQTVNGDMLLRLTEQTTISCVWHLNDRSRSAILPDGHFPPVHGHRRVRGNSLHA